MGNIWRLDNTVSFTGEYIVSVEGREGGGSYHGNRNCCHCGHATVASEHFKLQFPPPLPLSTADM